MNILNHSFTALHHLPRGNSIAIVIASTLLIGACATSMKSPEGAIIARNRLVQLQANPELARHASVAIRNAETSVAKAETPMKDKALSDHLVFTAGRQVDIAWALAETRHLEGQRPELSAQRDSERLSARTREADNARNDSNDLRRQIDELNAKKTDRGLVLTLGDMLFETGKSKLKDNATSNLYKLSSFLNTYPDRTLVIEGHTDNVGSDESNMLLSQARADSVQLFLLNNGISVNRLSASGKGENYPIASNDSISGRALNRRVEVIITDQNTNTSMLNEERGSN